MIKKYITSMIFLMLLVNHVHSQDNLLNIFMNDIDWSPSGDAIARAYDDGRVEVIEVGTDQVLFSRTNKPFVTKIAWNPDGNLLAIGTANLVEIWELASNQMLQSLQASPVSGTFMSEYGEVQEVVAAIDWLDDNKLLTLSSSGVLRVWQVSSGFMEIDTEIVQSYTAAWSPDGTSIVSVSGIT